MITTHVLDTNLGMPAEGIPVLLEKENHGNWDNISQEKTNSDGRVGSFSGLQDSFATGLYRLTFQTEDYFVSQNVDYFYPYVTIVFRITSIQRHFHVPVLLNPFGYSTYRGS